MAFELEINTSYNFKMLLTKNNESIKNKYKPNESIKSLDTHALFGYLYFIAKNNTDLLSDYGYTLEQVMEDASICDNKLYLNNFEGYELSDRLNLSFLYLNQYNCVMAGVYDNKLDRFIYFLAD